MKKITLYCFLFLTIKCLFSQTNVSGGIFNDTTWDINGSPYIVTSDIALFPNTTLTIEPGVIVRFNSGTKFILRGTLASKGTSDDLIVFTSNLNNPSKGDWNGIEIENNQGGKIIASHIKGEYADNFIRIMSASSGEVLNISNSEIRNSNRAIYGFSSHSNHTVTLDNVNINNNGFGFLYAQNVTLTNSVFSNGEKGILCWENIPNMNITNCEFHDFNIYAVSVKGGVVDNCYIHHNEIGINMNPDIIVKNSIIEFNTNGIVALNYPNQISGPNIFDNKICDNIEYNFKHQYSYPITLGNNCWCLSSESEISQTIYDAFDDISLGIVSFNPFNTDCSSSLSTEDLISDNTFNFYPNPANEKIFFKNNMNNKYEIYSVNGVSIKKGFANKELDISFLRNGFYLIKISGNNETKFITQKLIKK